MDRVGGTWVFRFPRHDLRAGAGAAWGVGPDRMRRFDLGDHQWRDEAVDALVRLGRPPA